MGKVDSHLNEKLTTQDPNGPTLVRIANSGYDAAHKYCFIACRDQASDDWVNHAIHSFWGPDPAGGSLQGLVQR